MRTLGLSPFLVAALLVASCDSALEGPTPTAAAPPAVEPAAVCVEQLSTWVTVRGGGMSPLPTGLLEDEPALVLPQVEVIRELDLEANAVAETVLRVPDSADVAELDRVRWVSQEEMRFQVYPELDLQPGLHTIRITNGNGEAGEWPQALLAVPRPQVTGVTPDLLCADADARFTLTGSFFIRNGATLPRVVATAAGGDAIELTVAGMDQCRALPGDSGAEACAEITIDLPRGTLPSGDTFRNYDVAVHNPDPTGCQSTDAVVLTMVPAPTLGAVEPVLVCTTQGDTAVTVTGTGFLTVDGVAPTLTIGTELYVPTATDCTPITGPHEAVQRCATLTATIPVGDFTPGTYDVSVTNPPPADCTASSPLELTVVAPPTLTGVTPNKLCAGGGSLDLTGTGFTAGVQVLLGGVEAGSVTVVSSTQLTATFGATGLAVGGPYPLVVQYGEGCGATLAAAVTVTPGPQLFFADPPVVYNGISTTITLWGSGYTGTISGIGLRPTGTLAAPTALTFTYNPAKANRVQAVVPEGTAAGDYDVLLSDQSACSAVLVAGLKVVDAVTLELTAITPPFGGTAAPTAVTVLADAAVAGGFQAVPRLYLSPQAAAQAEALGSVAFLDAGRVTGVVPQGLAVGTYDLIAVNPDGGVGLLLDAFTVTADPPPTITAITPGSIPNQTGQAVAVAGANFRQPSVLLRCLDISTNAQVEVTPPVTNPTATSLTMTVDASPYSMGAICVVRVVNGDNGTYGEYSSLVITNLAQNLTDFRAGPSLATPRRALAAVSNQATPAARFVYAIGGDGGATASALASVELAPVDIFGQPGAFFTQRDGLATARSYAAAATVGRCLYLVGGINDATILASVERACVLDPAERPEVTDLDLLVVPSAGLDAGLWYYQVAALLPASHALNPGGETLPSEPFPVLLPTLAGKQIAVTVHWGLVAGATGYRVYRSPAANAGSHELQLLGEVGSAVTSFADTGLAVQAGRPQQLGATGVWHALATTLGTARQGAGVAIAPDPADATGTLHNLYVFGGRTSASAAATSCERLAITLNGDGSQTVGTFVACGQAMADARWQLAVLSVGNENAALVTPPTRYLYASGGVAGNGTNMVETVEAFEILAGGALGAPVTVDDMQPFRAGYGYAAVNNFLFAFGGTQAAPNNTASSVKICAGAVSGTCPSGPPALENWNNVSGHLTVPRYLMGSAIQSGFIYLLGGTTDTAAATSSTEYTIW